MARKLKKKVRKLQRGGAAPDSTQVVIPNKLERQNQIQEHNSQDPHQAELRQYTNSKFTPEQLRAQAEYTGTDQKRDQIGNAIKSLGTDPRDPKAIAEAAIMSELPLPRALTKVGADFVEKRGETIARKALDAEAKSYTKSPIQKGRRSLAANSDTHQLTWDDNGPMFNAIKDKPGGVEDAQAMNDLRNHQLKVGNSYSFYQTGRHPGTLGDGPLLPDKMTGSIDPDVLAQQDWMNSMRTNAVHGRQPFIDPREIPYMDEQAKHQTYQYVTADPGMMDQLAKRARFKDIYFRETGAKLVDNPSVHPPYDTPGNVARMRLQQEASMPEPATKFPYDYLPHKYGGPMNAFQNGPTGFGYKRGGIKRTPYGQWQYPGQVTNVPSNQITMQGVPYPVMGVGDNGHRQMMMPGGEYTYPGATNVTEWPLIAYGGQFGPDSTGGLKHGGPTPEKAHEMLTDGTAHGRPLTAAQKRYFGMIYGRSKKYGGCKECGGMSEGGEFPSDVPAERKNEFMAWIRDTAMGQLDNAYNDYMKKGGFHTNPAHKGWCTPMSKPTCTGKRRQFAINAKNHFQKQQEGGPNIVTDPNQLLAMGYTPGYDSSGLGFISAGNLAGSYGRSGNDIKPASTEMTVSPDLGRKYVQQDGKYFMNFTGSNNPQARDLRPITQQTYNLATRKQQMGGPYSMYDTDGPSQDVLSQVPQYPTWKMDPDQMAGSPVPSQPKKHSWSQGLLGNPDIWNAGMEAVTRIANNIDERKQTKKLRKTTAADWWNPAIAGSRGDYTPNYGYFRPDQTTPEEQPGNAGFYHYAEGGEYYMDDNEIKKFLQMGGQLDVL